jgi:ATP-dependent exoDNAse (exonuclease V) alpha subunit
MQTSEEQQRAIDAVKQGNNVFMLGAGGVGKSFCISQIVKWGLENNVKVAVTATTGSAAFLINGSTIHSYLGIGVPGKNSTPRSVAEFVMKKRKDIVKKLKRVDIIVIDEISMLDDELFDFISEFLKIIRESEEPFGGVQLVLSGDLYQLPPCSGRFVFKSYSWKQLDITICQLVKSHRHKNDLTFSKILQDLRVGKCDDETLKLLKSTANKKLKNATYLFTKNCDVDEINEQQLASIIEKNGVKRVTYTNKNAGSPFAKNGNVPESVSICIGAQVMLTYNVSLDSGLCNGAKGVVKHVASDSVKIEFCNGGNEWIPFVKVTNPDDSTKWVEFIPVRLAYAITINKAQGSTLDRVVLVIDTIHPKAYGKVYTALSRVRSLDTISIRGEIKKSMFRTHPDIIEFIESL